MNQPMESYLVQANTTALRCVDERPTSEAFTAGIQIPGSVYGIIDVVKELKHLTEAEARTLIKSTGIPVDVHVDDHHGPKGCGYAKLVETSPSSIGITESVPAATRLDWVKEVQGRVITYLGDHNPKGAIINHRANTTFNSPAAWNDEQGMFNLDVWALGEYASKLGIDQDTFTTKMIDVYKKTVSTLTQGAITDFVEIT